MNYEFIALSQKTGDGSVYPAGHAMRWQPGEKLKLQLLVSQAAIERDFYWRFNRFLIR
ncbi:MAG: hypothetical protein JW953_03085 [Anaerolineae bacterium]|nr:hypothetical protein [Anaerolineae bacterium]